LSFYYKKKLKYKDTVKFKLNQFKYQKIYLKNYIKKLKV